LVVKNSYVASQEFNGKAAEGRAQAALGWQSRLTIADGKIIYGLADAAGSPVALSAVTMFFRRPAYEAEDRSVALSAAPDGTFIATETPRDGIWIVEVDAAAGHPQPYREVRRIVVKNGAVQ